MVIAIKKNSKSRFLFLFLPAMPPVLPVGRVDRVDADCFFESLFMAKWPRKVHAAIHRCRRHALFRVTLREGDDDKNRLLTNYEMSLPLLNGTLYYFHACALHINAKLVKVNDTHLGDRLCTALFSYAKQQATGDQYLRTLLSVDVVVEDALNGLRAVPGPPPARSQRFVEQMHELIIQYLWPSVHQKKGAEPTPAALA